MNGLRVAFRTDASPAMGTGHFMRCLTLADAAAKRGAKARFVCRHVQPHLRELAERHGHEVAVLPPRRGKTDELRHAAWLDCSQLDDARDSRAALAGGKWDWLVVDHYALDKRWEGRLRGTARRILAIDDLADRAHDCDLLLDQNLYADMHTRYAGKLPARCRTLLGPRHALLREEFARLRDTARPRKGDVRRVLVSFGGVDAENLTSAAMQALDGAWQVDVVIGAGHPDRAGVEAACSARGFACHVQTERMAELMAAADLAIASGGSSTWERCAAGLPTLTIGVAENQRMLVQDAARAGLLYAVDPYAAEPDSMRMHLCALIANATLREALSRRGLEAVDGRGAKRVLRAMGIRDVTVREATREDSAKVFRWRNHPSIRGVSRHAAAIARTSHDKWYRRVLREGGLLIGERRGSEIGVVRFDVEQGAAEVSIYLVPGAGEEGNGCELLLAAESWLARKRKGVRTIRATVLRDNHRSRGLFAACGYRLAASTHEKALSR